jgi:hypothetical protein
MVSMRTTISIDDDVFLQVKQYARRRSLRLGKAVSELVRRGFDQQRPTRSINGLQVFDLPANSPRVTTKRVEDLDAEQ